MSGMQRQVRSRKAQCDCYVVREQSYWLLSNSQSNINFKENNFGVDFHFVQLHFYKFLVGCDSFNVGISNKHNTN